MGYSFNGTTKVITLTAGTTNVSVRDMYSRWVDWLLTSDNSKYQLAFATVGGDDIDVSQGTKIPIYAFLSNGWRIKPQEANHTLNITDGILLVDGGGDPFINTTGSFVVRVNYQQPVQAISFSTGGGSGGLTPEQETMLAELYQLQGLAAGVPMTVNKTTGERTAGGITLSITGDDNTFVTVERQ
jgi:hypothetical protein